MEKYRFRANLTFIPVAEGGRITPARQGYRPDFFYEADLENGYQIWPRFLSPDGQEIAEGGEVPPEVDAWMEILDSGFAETVHRFRIRSGVKFVLSERYQVVARGIITGELESPT